MGVESIIFWWMTRQGNYAEDMPMKGSGEQALGWISWQGDDDDDTPNNGSGDAEDMSNNRSGEQDLGGE
jgi:hypothetical protein